MKTVSIDCARTVFFTFAMLSASLVFAQKTDSTASPTRQSLKKFTLKIGNDTVETEDQDIVDICLTPTIPPKFNHPNFKSFSQWLQSSLRYPQVCLDNDSIVRVVFSFIITKNGYLTHPTLLQCPDRIFAEEVLRVLRLRTPNWTPARDDKNENVSVKYVFVVDFRDDPTNIRVLGAL